MTKRWDARTSKFVETVEGVDAFLADLLAVCERHNMTLSHEDTHGAFVVLLKSPDEEHRAWLQEASVD